MSYSVLTQTWIVQYSLLHTWAVRYSLLLLGYKPVQHVTVLNTVGNCNTMVSIIILWDHCRICGLSFTDTSLCGAWVYMLSSYARVMQSQKDCVTIFNECHPFVLLIVPTLNQYLSEHNQVLFIVQNNMLRHASGHCQVHSWSIKHIEEEICFLRFKDQLW